MKKKIRLFISITIMLFLICGVNISSVKAENRVIKVGYISYPGFIQKTDNGTYEGYGVEYLNEIAKYNNWTYEFVENTWEKTLKNLKDGKNRHNLSGTENGGKREKLYFLELFCR